ncbi:zinc-finger homeodomain protein 9-like [Cucurbita moschata]|uniref:Zinc-finger homeodomain protein 9-like n=1 Tax=Cucurbita moschata TaxID=3662 RepID=A0A6J1F1H4_CUCMO|nr:zinc-finger homeodomain protein 9-like [Cucurbita moschata]
MDLTPAISTAVAAITTGGGPVKSPELDTDTPIKIQPTTKSHPFTNGVLKRHHNTPPPVVYKECLKNHAASLGAHALDGCGEFMPSSTATASDPTSLKCAACGCHRNFHRREPEDSIATPTTTHIIEYQPHHRHHPPPPAANRSPSSASPPPISSSYYPSAPHMLLALSGGLPENASGGFHHSILTPSPNSRKRFRTKFTQNQKEKMYEFAEKVGWKIQKRDEDMIQEFCSNVGVDRGVLKVWMHNNKNTLGKKDGTQNTNGSGGDGDGDGDEKMNGGNEPHAAANGSSSSS